MAIRAIITDFGNVLIPFDRRREAEGLVASGLVTHPVELVHNIITGTEGTALLKDFEEGRIIDEEFIHAFEDRLGAPLPRNRFWREHAAIFGEPNRPLVLLLRTLKTDSGMKLVGLANTDPYRLNYMLGAIRLPLDGVVASCFEGAAKPHPRLFRHALDIAGVPAADTLFIDDVLEYVIAARALGIQAHQYISFDALVAELRRLGVAV